LPGKRLHLGGILTSQELRRTKTLRGGKGIQVLELSNFFIRALSSILRRDGGKIFIRKTRNPTHRRGPYFLFSLCPDGEKHAGCKGTGLKEVPMVTGGRKECWEEGEKKGAMLFFEKKRGLKGGLSGEKGP